MSRQTASDPMEDLRRADPVLGVAIDDVECRGGLRPTRSEPASSSDPEHSDGLLRVLLRGIARQNISAFASRASYRKLVARFGGHPPRRSRFSKTTRTN
jgi:hypothetical protein